MQEYINMSYDTREYLRIEEKVRRVRQKKKEKRGFYTRVYINNKYLKTQESILW